MRAFLFHFIVQLSSWSSLRTTHRWATWVSRLVWRWSEKQRRITTTNIKLCYPQLSHDNQIQLAQDSLAETLKSMFELGLIWKKYGDNIDAIVRQVHGHDVLQKALDEGQGLLLAAPHFGNWEVLNLWLSRHPGFSFLYKPPKEAKIEQLLLRYRGQGGANQITADAKGVRQILQVLKQQRILAILPDQQPKSGQGIYAPFMGQPAYTMTLFSKMAIKTQAPVVLAVAERLSDGKGFDLHFRRASEAIYADLETSVATLNQEIATLVNLAPSQYQWTYKRFSLQADGSKPYRPQ